MKLIFVFAGVLLSSLAFSQTDTTLKSEFSYTQSSITTLTRTDIERLQATSFMDLVAGAFPFLGAEALEEEFSFVVNGFITTNPNVVNLSQLESIQFYPSGIHQTRGNLAKRGTFVINTKPEKTALTVSTKTGVSSIMEKLMSGGQLKGESKGLITQNELSYQLRDKNAFLSSGLSYLHDRSPGMQLLTADARTIVKNSFPRLRFSNFGSYRFAKAWAAEGAFFFTSQPLTSERNTTYLRGPANENFAADRKAKHLGLQLGLRFLPDKQFQNFFALEGTKAKEMFDENYQISGPNMASYFTTGNATNKTEAFVFSNLAQWKPVNTPQFGFGTSLLARYRKGITKKTTGYRSWSSTGMQSAQGSQSEIKSRSVVISPSLEWRLRQLLFMEAGITYDNYQTNFYLRNKKQNWLLNGGIKINLQPLANSISLSMLELSSHYQQYIRNFDQEDRLETDLGYFPSPSPFTGMGNYEDAHKPLKNWQSSIVLGWMENRIALKANYRQLQRMMKVQYPAPWMGGGGLYLSEGLHQLNTEGWSLELSATPLKKGKQQWTIAGTITREELQWEASAFNPIAAETLYMDDGNAPLRGGFRSVLNLHRFFLQTNFLFTFDELAFDKKGVIVDDLDTFRSNYLLAGYRLPLKSGKAKSLEVNLQSRNFFGVNNQSMTRYMGLGLHLFL